MKCKNCGAEYGNDSLKCPYCGEENKTESAKRFKAELNEKDKQIKHLEQMPERVVKSTTKFIIRLILASAAVVTLVVFLCFWLSGRNSANRYDTNDREYLELESMYEAGEYDAIAKYIDKNHIRGGKFNKFTQVADSRNYYIYFEKEITDLNNTSSDNENMSELYIKYALYYGCETMNKTNEYLKKGEGYGNKEALQEMYDKVHQIFTVDFKLTEEEIEDLCTYRQSQDFENMAVIVYGRMN